MNKYKLKINGIEKYARAFWDNTTGNLDENSESYINYMNNDTSELHNHIFEPLIVANIWGSNCSIPKEDLSVLEIDSDNQVIKSYSYQEVWDLLPKKKIRYKAEMENVNRGNLYTLLEPLTDVETGQVICMTNEGNLMFMMHTDLLEEYLNKSELEVVLEVPVYLLDKVDNQANGVLNKYFDKSEKF